MKTLVFATHNLNKLKEIQQVLGQQFLVQSLSDIGCHEEIPETALTLEGNAEIKAEHIHKEYNCNVFADDTGLEVEALNGEPGVFSARYAGPQKNADDNMALLLKKMQGKSNRKARFRTSICLILDKQKYFFEGIVEGQILSHKLGEEGFGYDPLFKPDGYTVSFAQMNMEEKNRISHRGRAVIQMISFLKERYKG